MLVSMLLPSNPEISLDPDRQTEVHVVVLPGHVQVPVGAVHRKLHLERRHVLEKIHRGLEEDSERDLSG